MMSESLTITEVNLPHYHVGQYLADDLEDLGMSGRQFAEAIGVSPNRITEVLKGKRRLTEDTAVRIARYLGTTPQIWLDLQTDYLVALAEKKLDQEAESAVK